jgi:hypothetical protein
MTAQQLGFNVTGDTGGAVISDCGRYRYRLWRRWGTGAHVLWVMLNPSTADEEANDPTIRKCVGFAKRWGHDAIEVVNLFAWRATDPDELLLDGLSPTAHGPEVVGPDNDDHIRQAVGAASLVVAAWGRHPSATPGRLSAVRGLLPRMQCLGRNGNASPRHPLMLGYDTVLEPFG